MLKSRFIFMSFLFLLLAGMNSNARASVAKDELVQNSTDEKESNNKSQEHESDEIITDLDFFGAFSLVNVQLQWKDFFIDLNEEESNSDATIDPKELFVDGVEFFTVSTNEVLPTPSSIAKENLAVPVSVYRTILDTVHFISNHRKQNVLTIAYILNCGTYPKSC